MTPTDDISDPTWHDLFDRDREIKRLLEIIAEQEACIRTLREHVESIVGASCEEAGG
jgi:hypothetical protein